MNPLSLILYSLISVKLTNKITITGAYTKNQNNQALVNLFVEYLRTIFILILKAINHVH